MRRKFNIVDAFEFFVAGFLSGLAVAYVIYKFI
jgi:hypothetical protein